jgi:hypothetical protein
MQCRLFISRKNGTICDGKEFGTQQAKDQVQTWQTANLKVSLSIGGDGQNKCWDAKDGNTESTCKTDNVGTLVMTLKH